MVRRSVVAAIADVVRDHVEGDRAASISDHLLKIDVVACGLGFYFRSFVDDRCSRTRT